MRYFTSIYSLLLLATRHGVTLGYEFITNFQEGLTDEIDTLLQNVIELTRVDTSDDKGVTVDSVLLGNFDDQWVLDEMHHYQIGIDPMAPPNVTGLFERAAVKTVCANPTCDEGSDPGQYAANSVDTVRKLDRLGCQAVKWAVIPAASAWVSIKISGRFCRNNGGNICQFFIGLIASEAGLGFDFVRVDLCEALLRDVRNYCKTHGGEESCQHQFASGKRRGFYTVERISTANTAPSCPSTRFGQPAQCYKKTYNG